MRQLEFVCGYYAAKAIIDHIENTYGITIDWQHDDYLVTVIARNDAEASFLTNMILSADIPPKYPRTPCIRPGCGNTASHRTAEGPMCQECADYAYWETGRNA